MVLQYSYIEARANKIMNLLNMPCAIVQNHGVYRTIGLNNKLGCIQQFLKQDQLLFEKSKLTNKLINDIKNGLIDVKKEYTTYIRIQNYMSTSGRMD